MRRAIAIFSFALFGLIVAGCASSSFSVKSEPADALVYVRGSGSEEKKELGKTPLAISFSDIQTKTGVNPAGGDFIEVLVEKNGFSAERFLVPAARMGSSETIILAKLRATEADGKVVHRLLQHLFNAQRLANDREFERAQSELDKAFAIDESFVRGMSLRGSIFFVQQKYDESLKWFEKALNLDPQFEDAVKMITKIKGIRGDANLRRETSSDGSVR